jgi:hypothetical protein
VSESLASVAAIAEGFIFRKAAAAQSDGSAAGKAESSAGGIDNFEVAFDTNRTVRETDDFGCGHPLDGSTLKAGANQLSTAGPRGSKLIAER